VRLEVFEKIATKTDDHNHPKTLQYVSNCIASYDVRAGRATSNTLHA
jgi:hypothetical protein